MISIILLFLSLSNAEASPSCGSERSEWSVCESSKDCTIASDMCGFKTAYNFKFLSEIEKFNRCMAPMIKCVSSKSDPHKNIKKAQCKNKICELVKE